MVQLLLGEIPERSIYHERVLSVPLVPYFKLTQGKACYRGNRCDCERSR